MNSKSLRNPKALFTATFVLLLIYGTMIQISMSWVESYGYSALVLPALLLGFSIAGFSYRYMGNDHKAAFLTPVLACIIVMTSFLVFGIEGLLATMMVAPLQVILVLIGALGAFFARESFKTSIRIAIISSVVLTFTPLLAQIESGFNGTPQLRVAQNQIYIDASQPVVWAAVDSTTTLPEPDEWIFRWGAGYPYFIEVDGNGGIGSWRHDDFPTGRYSMKVTKWDEPREMIFEVHEQPVPLKNINPFFGEVTPHNLRNVVYSRQGEFLIEETEDGARLRTTSRYHNGMAPSIYWGFLTDRVIREIHWQILTTVKRIAEEVEEPILSENE